MGPETAQVRNDLIKQYTNKWDDFEKFLTSAASGLRENKFFAW